MDRNERKQKPKQLVMLNGPMGVGKTTVGRHLAALCAPSAFLDGDWCWALEPFAVTPQTKDMVLANIAYLLQSYGACPQCGTVIFCWVMQAPDIVRQVLRRLPEGMFAPKLITLTASRAALQARVQRDIDAGLRGADALERALSYREQYGWARCVVDTTHLSPHEAACAVAARL